MLNDILNVFKVNKPTNIYLFKVINRNTKKCYQITTPDVALLSLLLTLNITLLFFSSAYIVDFGHVFACCYRSLLNFNTFTTELSSLTHFMRLASFYTPCKHQKIRGFLMFPRGYRKKPVA